MRTTFEQADFAAMTRLWEGFYPERFRVSEELLRQKTVASPLFDWGASLLELDGDDRVTGFVAIKRSANPSRFVGPDPDQAHITAIAFEDPAQGVGLLEAAKRVLRNRGTYRLLFGQDSGHLFPGCPMECHRLRDLLMVEGFTLTSHQVDLERDLADYTPPEGCLPVQGADLRPIGADDVAKLDEFLAREFPGRWHHDVMNKIEVEDRSDFVVGVFVDDVCEGFALTQQEGCRLPIGGAVWHADLGPNWGALGPIGVSKRVRGKGYGDGILGYGLQILRERGARQSIIDWTTLVEFYGKHGFEPLRQYDTYVLRLDAEDH